MNSCSIKLLVPALLVLLVSCRGGGMDQKIMQRSYAVNTASPDENAFLITNNGSLPATFSIKINGTFYLDMQQMADSVKRLSNSLHEPLEKSAWRFVKSVTTNCEISNDKPAPDIWLNSSATGTCYDEAAALAALWGKLGYKARIWGLSGHVVPEVYVNGRWEMYDPSLKVFYLDKSNHVASVEELVNDTSLLHNVPGKEMPDGVFSRAMCQSQFIAGLYLSKENNKATETPPNQTFTNLPPIVIPAGASIEFPAVYKPAISFMPNLANLRLLLKKESHGMVDIPLILIDLQGKGSITLDGKEFEIGDSVLQSRLKEKGGVHSFNIVHAETDISFIYLVNPKIARVLTSNVVSLWGNNLDSIAVSLAHVDSIFQLRYQPSEIANEKIRDDYRFYFSGKMDVYSKLNFATHPINSRPSLVAMIATYVNLDNRLNKSQKQELQRQLLHKLDLLLDANSKNDDEKHFLEMLNEPKTFILFASTFKNLDEAYLKSLKI